MQSVQRNPIPFAQFRRNSMESLTPNVQHSLRQIDGTRSLRKPKPPTIRKLSGAAHFHYDNVELGPIQVHLEEFVSNDDAPGAQLRNHSTTHTQNASSRTPFIYSVTIMSNGRFWSVKRTYQDFLDFDKQLHRCVYDRRISRLSELSPFADVISNSEQEVFDSLSAYVKRFSDLAGSLITCFPVLKWLELDNRGNRLLPAEETLINTPAVAAAYVVRDYSAQANNELSLNIGDIISVIDMPPSSESFWWRGKLTIGKRGLQHVSPDDQPSSPLFEVGFFPSDCVQLFGSRLQILPPVLRDGIYDKPVFRRRGKLVAFFRAFLTTRPSRRRLKESGILLERVFGCDLAEHLQNTGNDVPSVLKACCKVLETHGVVDGIYRLSGALSNIQKLRSAFDDNKEPDLLDEAILRDIHCVASLLKMYFRELPNPLLTYQLYSSFVEAAKMQDHGLRVLCLHDVVQQLPPPHFRTAEFLIRHLSKVGEYGYRTGMTFQNLAIVWAPNLLRCKELENTWESATVLLRNVNVQAVIVEYLIRYVDIIFSRKLPMFASLSGNHGEPGDCSSLNRQSRPQSLTSATSPKKLIDLEEAQRKLIAARFEKLPAGVGLPDLSNRKCIDVNGGPAALPIKYHTIIEIPSRIQRKGSGWRNKFLPKTVSNTGSSTALSKGRRNLLQHIPFSSNPTPDETNRRFLRHVKSAESLVPSAMNTSEVVYRQKHCKSLNRRSLRETTPLRDYRLNGSRRSETPMKSCLTTDLDAAYSSNESHLFGAVHPRYDERRRASFQHHHGHYAISVHVNLEEICPMNDMRDEITADMPRRSASLKCCETNIFNPNANSTVVESRAPFAEMENFDDVNLTCFNQKKIAKVSPMTDETHQNNEEVQLQVQNSAFGVSTTPTIFETNENLVDQEEERSKQYADKCDVDVLPAINDEALQEVNHFLKKVGSFKEQTISPSSTLSSVYTINLFDEIGQLPLANTIPETIYTSSSDDFESIESEHLVNTVENVFSSILDSDSQSDASAKAKCEMSAQPIQLFALSNIELSKSEETVSSSLDPELRTLLSSVENLPDLSDTSSYTKKFSSFKEANALLKSLESLNELTVINKHFDIDELIDEDDDDDDELLISLYENVDEDRTKKTNSNRSQKQLKYDFLTSLKPTETTKTPTANEMYFKSRKLSDFAPEEKSVRCRTKESDSRYSSTDDTSSIRSTGLKISEAIAMFEKSSTTFKSNPSSRESSIGRSGGRNLASALSRASRRPPGLVLVRTPSSYDSADENELANSPLYRKQQNQLLPDFPSTTPTSSGTDDEAMAVVERHHCALISSLGHAKDSAGSTKSLHNTNTTVNNGKSEVKLYFV